MRRQWRLLLTDESRSSATKSKCRADSHAESDHARFHLNFVKNGCSRRAWSRVCWDNDHCLPWIQPFEFRLRVPLGDGTRPWPFYPKRSPAASSERSRCLAQGTLIADLAPASSRIKSCGTFVDPAVKDCDSGRDATLPTWFVAAHSCSSFVCGRSRPTAIARAHHRRTCIKCGGRTRSGFNAARAHLQTRPEKSRRVWPTPDVLARQFE